MAATQIGTGSLTVGGQATAAAVAIAVPSGCVVESVETNLGGTPIYEDYFDADGAHHTRVTYEKGMNEITITLFGVAFTTAAGVVGGGSNNEFYIESNQKTETKSPVRSVVRLTQIPTEVA